MVAQDLVRLPKGFIQRCNNRLRDAERPAGAGGGDDDDDDDDGGGVSRRPRARHGVYLALDEPYGLLVTDMTGRADGAAILVEFKPKWLAQSPTAPVGARRCRNCALHAMRNATVHPEKSTTSKLFCPLDLLVDENPDNHDGDGDDLARLDRVVETILSTNNSISSIPGLKKRTMKILSSSSSSSNAQSLLQRLRLLQTTLDPHGVLHSDPSNLDLRIAMTLRDCTVFIKVFYQPFFLFFPPLSSLLLSISFSLFFFCNWNAWMLFFLGEIFGLMFRFLLPLPLQMTTKVI